MRKPYIFQNFKKVIIILITLIGYGSLNAQSIIQAPDPAGSADSIFDNHVSSLISIGQDSLLAVWFGGYVEGDEDNVVYSKQSFDGGQSWVNRDTIFNGAGDTLFRDPHLFYWQDTLYMLFNRQVGEGSVRNVTEYKLALSHSLDKGESWSAPSILSPGGTGSNLDLRIVAPFNEHIEINNHPVFGIHWRETGVSQPHISLLHLDLQNDTSFLVGDLTASYNIVEPALLNNGSTLYLYMRNTEGFIQYSTSSDYGVTWTSPVNTKLVCSYSLSSIKQIASDSILVVWNNHRNQRDYLTAGLCKSFDLSDIYWAKDLDYQKSFRGQVSYPATLIFSKDSIGVSYTDRLYLGRDVNNKSILRGTIRYETVSFTQRNDLAPYISPLDSIQAPTLLNEITQITNDRYLVLGDDAWAKVYDQQFVGIDTLNLNSTPYDLNHAILDSANNLIHILCNGGYYARYDDLNKTVTHQKRFLNLGAFNLNHGLLKDSSLYVVTFNGDLGQINHPDSNGSILIAGNGLAKNRIIGDSIFFLLGDSLGLSTFNRLNQQSSSQNTSITTHEGFSDALIMDSVLVAVGGRGYIAKYFLNGSGLNLTQLFNGEFNFNTVLSLNDSLLFIGSDTDIGMIYNLKSDASFKIKLLPKKQHGLGTISKGQNFLWYTIEGGVYELSKQQLISEALSLPIQRINSVSFFQSYPQPLSDFLIVESTEVMESIRLRNLSGQLLKEINISGSLYYRLDTSDLMRGRYVLSVKGRNGAMASALLLKQ